MRLALDQGRWLDVRLLEAFGPFTANIIKGESPMKKLFLALVTLAVATAFTAPAFAAITDAKTKADCEKAGGVWMDKEKKCGAKKS
jgi:uncharacterized lipoprotein YddW (UPF0748 family)